MKRDSYNRVQFFKVFLPHCQSPRFHIQYSDVHLSLTCSEKYGICNLSQIQQSYSTERNDIQDVLQQKLLVIR